MKEVLFALPGIALTVLCWGMYGPVLHKGQAGLGGDRLKPLICVGIAYFVVAIIIPTVILTIQGKLGGDWKFNGLLWSVMAGCAGAFGALGIILALTAGGKPFYVMPMVFGFAPVVNVIMASYFSGANWRDAHPIFYAGLIMLSMGAGLVLVFAPKGAPHPPSSGHAKSGAPTKVEKETALTPEKDGAKKEEAGVKS